MRIAIDGYYINITHLKMLVFKTMHVLELYKVKNFMKIA